jgi:anti-anti-sigma regulatory factor
MLRITINETPEELAIRLEGRVAGPWAVELGEAWSKAAPGRQERSVTLDLRNVTGVDENGKQILRAIESQTAATLIATTPWARQLADEICSKNLNG